MKFNGNRLRFVAPRVIHRLSTNIRFLAPYSLLLVGVAVAVALFGILGSLINSDFATRNSSTQTVGVLNSYNGSPAAKVSVLLVVHPPARDDNYCEVQAFLSAEDSFIRGTEKDHTAQQLSLEIRDASGLQPFELTSFVTLGSSDSLSTSHIAYSYAASAGPLIRLPVYSSVVGFPFDVTSLRPDIAVHDLAGTDYPFELRVEKGFPGRLVKTRIDDGGLPLIEIERSWLEKGFYCSARAVFILILLTVTLSLFRSESTLTGLQEVLAAAGFLLASAGFRSAIGIPQHEGVTCYEAIVLGLPLLFLATGLAFRAIRSQSMRKP
jgi:hypothetical protein